GRSDGVCERNKQTEHPWSACKKAPSVAVTWGWGSHELLADLGNNALLIMSKRWVSQIFHKSIEPDPIDSR
ncbi:MAG: hypothetical protein ACRC5V_08610, partial [Aeromonas sp.]